MKRNTDTAVSYNEKLHDDYKLKIGDCNLEPMFELDASALAEILVDNNSDRCSEDGDEFETIQKALSECVDFKKLSEMIPKLWYLNGKEAELTKADLLDACD